MQGSKHDVKLLFEAEAKTLRPRPESLEAEVEAEARSLRPRLRPNFWPRGQFGLEALTSLEIGVPYYVIFCTRLDQYSMRMFADDVKIRSTIRTDADNSTLQEDLNSLSRWSSKWLLKLNSSKCKVMHIGHSPCSDYHITDDAGNSNAVEQITEEKDLGVMVY